MALNDGLFANPTTGESDFGASKLKESQRAFKSLLPEMDQNTEELKKVISDFTTSRKSSPQSQSANIDLSDIMAKYGATDYEESAGAEGGLSGFFDATASAANQGFNDVSLGASLVTGDMETNLLAAEQKYQKSLGATNKRLGYDENSFSRFFDADWLGNVAGGTMPTLAGMFGGGALGIKGGPVGMLGGATVGSGGMAGLQTLGGTFTEAYNSYRSQGKSNREAFSLAYDVAKVDAFKSGAFASVATLVAPLRVTGNVLKPTSLRVASSFAANKPILGQAVNQAVQQTLILQPSLEVSDVILSNKIARNSFDTDREIYKGALDAAVGSIFFDFPTTSAGLAYNYARSGKLKAPFSPESGTTPLGIADNTGEARSVDGEVLGPENLPTTFDEDISAATSGTIIDLDPNDFKEIELNPDNQQDRITFLQNQVKRMETYDADKRANNENYSGDVKVANTVNFFKWLAQADKIIQQINSIKDVAVKNSEVNQRKLGDAQERISITKLMMDPVKNVVVPRYVFQVANGQVYRVVLSKNGNPLSPFQKSGKPQKTHITVFDPTSKTGTRSLAKSSGTLSSSGIPVPKNILLSADVYSRLVNARNRMFAEMDEADAFDAANQPVPQGQLTQTETKRIAQSEPTPVELTERQAQAQEKIETAAQGEQSDGVIPVTQDDAVQPPLPFNQTQTPPAQTGTQYFADPETGQFDMNQGFDFSTRPTQDQVIDQAEAETEIEYTQKTTKPKLPDGKVDTMSAPITSLSDGKNTLYTSRMASGIDSTVAWYQVNEKGFNIDTPAYTSPLPIGNNKAEAIETLKNKLAQMSEDQTVKFARTQDISQDRVQRAGELPLGSGIEALLNNIPGNDKPAIRRIINMFAKTLGKSLERIDVVNLASYLTRMEIDPDIADGMIGAYLRGWVKQTEGNLERGAIAIRLNQQPSTRVESLAHELVHFGIKMKGITPEMMVDMYNSIPDTDFNKNFIENDPYYKDLDIATKAEEYIAYTLGEMVENRYRGPITRRSGKYESKVQYFIRQIIRAVREFFERITGKNLVDDYLNNIKTKYGMDTEANNEFEDQTAVYGRVVPVPDNNPNLQERMNVESPLEGGNYIDLDVDNNADRDVTGKTYTGVEIGINDKGTPSMVTSDIEAEFVPPEVVTGKIGKAVNLINPSKKEKKRYRWSWVDRDNDTDPIHTLVSVTSTNNLSSENGGATKIKTPSGDHQYALKVNMNGATKLATFPDSPDQPRLRPVMYAPNVELGPIAGRIKLGTKEHNVYEYITLSDATQDVTPVFGRKKGGDRGGIDTPSKSIEDIQRAIPEYKRASVQKAPNTISRTINGEKFTELDLNKRGIGYVGKKPVSQIWQETLDKVPGARAELKKLKLENTMVPREEEFWNAALKLPDRARYWYEVSSEVIGNYFPDLTKTEIEKFWDVVAATSPMADPIDNMFRTIALLSEHYQSKPITTDLVSPTAVSTALSDELLGAPKTRSFSGTFLYLSGVRNEVPLSTNDRQVASSFGITGDDIANNFVMYHILSEFYIGIRNEQNANLPSGVQPYETWQIQAPAWVHERGLTKASKNELQNYDDYALVLENRVIPKLKEAGISIPDNQLTKDVLRNPNVPYALRENLLGYQQAYVGTVEVNTQSNVVGKQFEENSALMRNQEGFVGLTKEADTIIADGMRKLTARSREGGKKLPSVIDRIASAMVGKKVSMVRVTTDGFGTYAGSASPNIRIPMRYKDAKGYGNFDEKDVDVFLSLLSGPLGQEAAAAGLFVDANMNEASPAGFDRTFSVFVKTGNDTRPDDIDPRGIGELSAKLNKPVSMSIVANGYLFDIHLEGGPSITDPQVVSDAVAGTGLALLGEIYLIPRDYKVRYFERIATPYSDGYSKIISDFKKGIINEATQEIADLSPRIGKGQARDFIIGNIEEITTVPSSIQKRIERIRLKSRERVNNLDEVRDRVRDLHDEMKAKQKAFNKKVEPKLENLRQRELRSQESQETIAPYPEDVDTENDIDPLFARPTRNYSKTQERLEKISKNSFTGIFTSSARRLVGLARGTEIGYKLANILDRDKYARTSRDTTGTIEMDVHEEINQGLGKFTQQFNNILNNMTTAQIKLVPDLLRGRFVNKQTGRIQITPEMQRVGLGINKAVELRKLMNDLYGLIEQTYAKYGAPPPPKILMYFPQIYKLDGKFTEGLLRGLDKTQGLQDFFRQVFTNDGVQNADVKAQDLVSKILNEGNAPTWGFDLATVAGQKVFRFTPQEMRRVINMNPYQEFDVTMSNGRIKKMKLADFLDNDTYGVLQKYITTTVRRMAFVNRFGPKAEKITEAVNEGGTIDQELGRRGEAPLSPEDRTAIFNLIRANLGILPTHSFFGAGKSDRSYGAQQGIKSFTNLLFLNLSFLPATLEPLIAFNRLGMFGGLATLNEYAKNTLRMPYRMVKSTAKGAFTKGTIGDKYREFKKTYDADDSDLQIFAKHIGTIFEGFQYAYQNAAEVNSSVKWEKVDQIIFKYNLLQPITDATRVAALRGAIVSLPHWAKKAKKGSKMYTRYLQEVGLVASDLDMFDPADPMGTSNPKIRAALNDIVASIIIAPDAGRKPTWMSDPRFGLLSHIKTWTFTFTNTVLQRSYKELMAHGNPMPLVYLAGFGAMLSLQHTLREWMTYGEEGNPFLNEMFDEDEETARFIYNAFERGGLFGVFQFVADYVVGSRIGRQSFDPGGTMIPAYNLLRRFGDALAGLLQAVNTDAREQAKGLRKAFDNFTRLTPLLSITGQLRKDLVDYVTPKAPRKRKGVFSFPSMKAFGGSSFKSFGR